MISWTVITIDSENEGTTSYDTDNNCNSYYSDGSVNNSNNDNNVNDDYKLIMKIW